MNNITYAVSVDVNNPIIPYNVYVASVLDSNVRYLEITLYQNGNAIALSNEATATASLVTDNVLIDDSVECTISNNIITVPLEDLQRHGNLDVQVTVTEDTQVLAIPFPIQVKVTPNIAEGAQVDENSMGSYAEVVQEIAEARGTYDSLDEKLRRLAAEVAAEVAALSGEASGSSVFITPEMFGAQGATEIDKAIRTDLERLEKIARLTANNGDTTALFTEIAADIGDGKIVTPQSFDGENPDYAAALEYDLTQKKAAFDAAAAHDTELIQAAINTAVAGNIPFRATQGKVYAVNNTININISNPEYKIGVFDFNGACLKAAYGCTLDRLLYYYTNDYPAGGARSWYQHAKVTVKSLIIDGNGENAHTGMFIGRSYGAVFEKINVYNTRRGIYMQYSTESIIRDCFMRRDENLDVRDQLDIDPLTGQNSLKHAATYKTESREEILDGDLIDPVKTLCVGIEYYGSDAFIEDCVTVNYVIGIRVEGSDNKITGCHPWNVTSSQIYSSVCFFTAGNNYFSNCTCDRFRIGVYLHYLSTNIFVNTLFTNKDASDLTDCESYCWFFNERYAKKAAGASVKALNTKINGNLRDTQHRYLNWCNSDYAYFIDDMNTTEGYAIGGYVPSINEGDKARYRKIEQITGANARVIAALDGCAEAADTENANNSGVSSVGILRANANSIVSFADNGVLKHSIKGKTVGKMSRIIMGMGGTYIRGHKYYISFQYKSAPTRYKIGDTIQTETVDGQTVYKALPVKFRVYNGKESFITLESDNTEHHFTHIFEADDYGDDLTNTSVVIGICDTTFEPVDDEGESLSSSVLTDYLTISNVCVWDISNVARYLFESDEAFKNRVYELFFPLSNNVRDYTPKNVTAESSENIAFVSLRYPLNFSTYNGEDVYTVRYDGHGRAVFKYTAVDQLSDVSGVAASAVIPVTDRKLCFDAILASDYVPQAPANENDTVRNTFALLYADAPAGYKDAQAEWVYDRTHSTVAVTVPREAGTMTLKVLKCPITVTLSSFRLSDELKCDQLILDSGKIQPVYNGGEIYAVLKGSAGTQGFARALPTVLINTTPNLVFNAETATDIMLSGKVDKVDGKGLSTNDYTTAEKNKLGGIEAQANKTVVDSSLSGSSTNPVQNKIVKAALDGKYEKPSGGIPKTDLASAVQTSLGKADTALQSYTEQYTGTITGITMNGASKGTSGVVNLGTVITSHQDISGKLNIAQGVANSGKFLVVGSDGNVTLTTLSAWQGGNY